MNLRDYDNLQEIRILHTLFHLSLEILFPFNTFFFFLIVALPHNVFHQQRKIIYLPLPKGP